MSSPLSTSACPNPVKRVLARSGCMSLRVVVARLVSLHVFACAMKLPATRSENFVLQLSRRVTGVRIRAHRCLSVVKMESYPNMKDQETQHQIRCGYRDTATAASPLPSEARPPRAHIGNSLVIENCTTRKTKIGAETVQKWCSFPRARPTRSRPRWPSGSFGWPSDVTNSTATNICPRIGTGHHLAPGPHGPSVAMRPSTGFTARLRRALGRMESHECATPTTCNVIRETERTKTELRPK